jgi:DNA-binding PadR family transcriptional regulator
VLTSEWNTEESRPRKFYRTSAAGDRLAAELLDDWKRIDGSIRRLDQGDPE